MVWKDKMAVLWINILTNDTYCVGHIERATSPRSERYKFKYAKDIHKIINVGGFEPFREFEVLEGKEQTDYITVSFPRFFTRVPSLKRIDIKRALQLHGINIHNITNYDLLLFAGGRLVTDNIATVNPNYVTELWFALEDKKNGNSDVQELLDIERWQQYHQQTMEIWTNYIEGR
jgi:hypothetical protein